MDIKEGLNNSGYYFLFGSICLVGVIFILIFVPETKGKTNEDMRNYFLNRIGKKPLSTCNSNGMFQDDNTTL